MNFQAGLLGTCLLQNLPPSGNSCMRNLKSAGKALKLKNWLTTGDSSGDVPLTRSVVKNVRLVLFLFSTPSRWKEFGSSLVLLLAVSFHE